MSRIHARTLRFSAGLCLRIPAAVGQGRAVCPPAAQRSAPVAVAGSGPARGRRRHRPVSRLVSAMAGVVVAGGLAIPAASAAPGGLAFAGCVGDLAGCAATSPANALDGSSAVTVVGNQVYTASSWEGTVSHFTMDLAGNLTYDGCLGNLPGCTALSSDLAISTPTALAAANGQLYVASADSQTVSHFTIDPAGNLTFADCYGSGDGCTPVTPADALKLADGLAITPDGQQLYTTSYTGSVVSHFTIDAAGNLAFAGCIGDLAGCTSTSPAGALDGAWGVAITPDGQHLYAASLMGNAISHFTIDSAGNLTFAGCIGSLTGCATTSPAGALNGADALVVTPDGHHLYAAATTANAVSHFTIDPAGNLNYAGCIGDLFGCATMTPGALDGADALAITSDGAHVYAAGGSGHAISHFTMDAAGNLNYAGCIGDHAGCATTSPAGALVGVNGLAVTGDGAHLYATAFTGNAVSHFAIAGFTTANPPGGPYRRICHFNCNPLPGGLVPGGLLPRTCLFGCHPLPSGILLRTLP